jgi:hypothetical protein
MNVTRLLGIMGVVGLYGIVVGVTRLNIKLPLALNIVCIGFGSKSASHSWVHCLLLQIMFFEERGCTQHRLEIQEIPRMWWLKYGPYFHESIDYFMDDLIEHLRQVHGDFICNTDISNNFSLCPILTM